MPNSRKYFMTVGLGISVFATVTLFAADNARFGYGSPASPEQIAAWDIDVRPDGQGLPPGRGSVEDGEALYEEKCAVCHGSFGESVAGYPALAGGEGSLTDPRPHKTVGSYWRYTSTLWDYIHRAMPFTQPESLADDEVYAITAYVLYLNDIVDYDFVLTRDNLSSVRLPNEDNFVPDPRPDTRNTRCMTRCKNPQDVKIASEAAAYDPRGGPGVLGIDEGDQTGGTQGADADSIALGREIAADRNRGNCYSCHMAAGAQMTGNAGPALMQMRLRFPDREVLKAQIADPRIQNPDTVMPPYGAHGILTTGELDLVVDYIHSSNGCPA